MGRPRAYMLIFKVKSERIIGKHRYVTEDRLDNPDILEATKARII